MDFKLKLNYNKWEPHRSSYTVSLDTKAQINKNKKLKSNPKSGFITGFFEKSEDHLFLTRTINIAIKTFKSLPVKKENNEKTITLRISNTGLEELLVSEDLATLNLGWDLAMNMIIKSEI